MSYSHTRLVYKARVASTVGMNYIDLTRGLALINGKNCSQFTGKDVPISVTASVRLSSSAETVLVAKSTWAVRNACVKAAAAWRRTLRSAGVRRKSQLNTYARNPRFALNEDHSKCFGALGTTGDADIIPNDVPNSYMTGQYAKTTGNEIQVLAYNTDTTVTPFSPEYVRAFTQTTFAVPQSGATDVLDKPANLLGATSSTYSNVVAEYIDSRINDADVEDTDMDATPSIDNDFVMMLAPGEEVADDVLDNIDDEGRWRPYSMATSTTGCDAILPDANVAGQDTIIEAPLGLLEWAAKDANSLMVIDIIAMTEM